MHNKFYLQRTFWVLAALGLISACASSPTPHQTAAPDSKHQFNQIIAQQPSAAGNIDTVLFGASNADEVQSHVNPAYVKRSRLATLNGKVWQQALSGAGNITFNLFDDAMLIAKSSAQSELANGGRSWTGTSIDSPLNLANVVTDKQNNITGTILSQGYVYDITPIGNGLHRISEIEASALPDELPPIVAPTTRIAKNTATGTSSTIDVLVAYTSKAAKLYPDIAQRIQVAVDQANASFHNSGVVARIKLVGAREVAYQETDDASVNLRQLASGKNSKLATVLQWREDLKADVVSLWTANNDSACGAAFAIGSGKNGFTDAALNTVSAACASNTLSFANVIGRNLGLGTDGNGIGGLFPYSRGYINQQFAWRTLDASSSACRSAGSYCYRLPVVSTPLVSWSGNKVGSESANNARTLQNSISLVASLRGSSDAVAENNLIGAELAPSEQSKLLDGQYQPSNKPFVKRTRVVWVPTQHLPNAIPSADNEKREIALTLFPGVNVVAKQTDMEFRSPQMASWSGEIAGNENGRVNLVINGNQVTGMITMGAKIYRINPIAGGAHEIQEIDQTKFPKDHPDSTPTAIADAATSASGTGAVTMAPDGTGPIIDVLVIYTPQSASATVAADIQLAFDVTNSAYAASGANQRVRLVKAIQSSASYIESSDLGVELTRLQTNGDGYLDEAAALRDQFGADTVVLWAQTANYCGMAYLNTTPSTFANMAYSVVNKDCASSNYSFPHELGHNMGMNHDMYVSASEPSSYPYSHGYVNKIGGWRTIMAYNNACADANTYCTRIGQFSNPDKMYSGAPTGDSNSNAAMVLNNTAPLVSTYRPSSMSQYNTLFVTGNFNNWALSGASGTMTWKGQGNWEAQVTLATGSQNYNFLANNSQAIAWGDNNEATAVPQSGVAGLSEGYINVNVTQAGNYTIKFNENTLAFSLALTPASTIKRTVIYMYGITQPGQDMFMRGGLDWTYAKNNLGKDCAVDKWLCAIPITHNLRATDITRSADKHLDWYGAETGQGAVEGSPLTWTTNLWPTSWGAKKTVAVDGFGEDPENTFGAHYWKLDVQMDCTKTVNGWFELKSFISNGPGWEGNVSQSGSPYVSGNHFGKCGYTNVFKRNDPSATLTPLP